MASRNKIGFHGGSEGNLNGIGDYIDQLTQNRIPCVFKSVDDMAGLYDAQEAARNSGVDHILIYRKSGQQFDTPNYDLTPYDAAVNHWELHKSNLPHELDSQLVWLETINEPDKAKAAWLGEFAYHTGKMAVQAGFKWLAFGFSSGEPEVEFWRNEWVLEYLRLCQQHPDKLGVALHEYSFDVNNIWAMFDHERGYGSLIGRFRYLLDICEVNGIAKPFISITEWGWEYNDIPNTDKAMNDIKQVSYYYNQYGLPANIWYLGGGYGGIANKVQKLISPLTHWTANTILPDPDNPPDNPCYGLPRTQYSRQYWLVTSTIDEARYLQIAKKAYARKVTLGFSADDGGIGALEDKLVLVHGHEFDPATLTAWYASNYPRTVVEFANTPQKPMKTLFGLHGSANYTPHIQQEAQVFENAKIDLVKVLSNADPDYVMALAQARPNAKWIVRAFLHFGGRLVPPDQFFNDTISDINRTLSTIRSVSNNAEIWIEIHNEPNLVAEGLGSSWADGNQFSSWLGYVIGLYKQVLKNVKYLYPGLSPTGEVIGIAQDYRTFLSQSLNSGIFKEFEGLAAHAYWGAIGDTVQDALNLIQWYANQVKKPLFVTEASYKPANAEPALQGQQYIEFWEGLANAGNVNGVTYFISSASNPEFQNEAWILPDGTSKGIDLIVGGR